VGAVRNPAGKKVSAKLREENGMGAKFKEINTLSFIGNIGPKAEKVWKEVDEEIDIVGCKDKFDRPCQLIAPLKLLERDLPGDGDTRQIPIFVNDDVRMELMHCRSAKGADGRRPAGFCETQIQVQNKRITKTPEGDFELVEATYCSCRRVSLMRTAATAQRHV